MAPESPYDIAVQFDYEHLPENKGKDTLCGFNCNWLCNFITAEWAAKAALLKRNCFAAVFEKYFELQAKGGEKSTAIIHYRDRETMCVGMPN